MTTDCPSFISSVLRVAVRTIAALRKTNRLLRCLVLLNNYPCGYNVGRWGPRWGSRWSWCTLPLPFLLLVIILILLIIITFIITTTCTRATFRSCEWSNDDREQIENRWGGGGGDGEREVRQVLQSKALHYLVSSGMGISLGNKPPVCKRDIRHQVKQNVTLERTV